MQAQAPLAQFAISQPVCLNQNLVLQNQSTNASAFTWDFCFEDLNTIKDVTDAITLTGSTTPTGISLFKDNANWFGFVSSRDNNKLFRLEFGNSLENTPIIIDLGNVGGLLNGPQSLVFIKENNILYGILSNYTGSNLIRLSFSGGVNAPPVAQSLGSFGMASPRGIDLVRDASNNITVAVADDLNSKIELINFGNTILNNPTLANTIDLHLGANLRPIGIRLMNDGSNWFGFASLFSGNMITRIDFGVTLSSTVTLTDIYSVSNPTEISFQKEGLTNHLFIATASGDIHQLINPNLPLIQIQTKSLGRFGVLNNMFGFEIARSSPVWYGFAVDFVSKKVSRIKFQGDCSSKVTINNSNLDTPKGILYKISGDNIIELTTHSAIGEDTNQKLINILNLQAPLVSIGFDNICKNSPVAFQAIEISGLTFTSLAWDFGDGNTSGSPTPVNQYTNTGIYSVTLDVTTSNTCSNRIVKDIQIFNPPSASFVLPSGLICTNNQFTFANNTVDNFDGNLTYQWYIDNAPIATTRDLNYAFQATGNKEVKLVTSIPGCSSEQTQTISNVLPGPVVGFAITGKCENENILFANNSSGSITGYSWDFGNSQTSTLLNPTQNYSKGSYMVSLQAFSTNGCINSASKNLTIYSNPQPDFSIGLPPFSCTGSASQFTDLTLAPTDSNIATWTWGFGDAANGSSSVKNPSYTYATASTYNVSLAVATNFGCTNSVQKAVTISPSPVAGFSNLPACVNQATQFTDASSGSIKSRLWQIQSSTFTTPNPQYTYPSSGTFPVVLTVTGNNNCVSQASKNILVPVVPALDFSVQAPCANSPSVFTELTTSADPSISKSWSFDSQGTGSGSPVQYAFSSTGTYVVRLNSTRQSGCVYSVSKNVSIVSPPVADFVPSIDAGAAPLPVSFTNNSSGANSYLWKFGDPGNSTSVLVSPTFVFSELGAYNVELSASNSVGCTNRLSKPISVVVPNVDAELTDFFFVKDPNTGSLQPVVKLLNRSNITLTNPIILLDVAGGSGVSQQITGIVKPNQEISQMLDLKLVPKTNQYVCAEVVVAEDSDTFLNRKCLSLSGEEVLFTPFPNPAREQLNLDWISIDGSAVTFQVLTSAGAVSLQQTISSINLGLNRLIINTSALSTGIYFIRFRDGKTDRTFSFAVAGN